MVKLENSFRKIAPVKSPGRFQELEAADAGKKQMSRCGQKVYSVREIKL